MKISNIKNFPAIFTVLPLAAGILICYYFKLTLFEFDVSFLIFLQIFLVAVLIFIYTKLRPGKWNLKYFYIYSSLLLIFGIIRFHYQYYDISHTNVSNYTEMFKNKNLNLYGTVLELPDIKENRIRVLIQSDSIETDSGIIRIESKILCYIYKNKYAESFLKKLNYGDLVEIKGELNKLPHKRNPGEFDYGEYLRIHNIEATFTSFGYDRIKLIGKSKENFLKDVLIYPVKSYSINVIESLVEGDEGEFLKGLVLGERSNISREIKEDFINAGVAHIIAVSGLNVAYVIIIIGSLLLLIPIKHAYKIFIMIVCLIFYMNLTGNVPSIIRATIMAGLFLLSTLLERKPNPFSIISFSALVILLFDSKQLLDSGFILSYCAVLSILLIYPKFHNLISNFKFYTKLSNDNYIHKFIKFFIILTLVTLAAQAGILPVTAIMFSKISTVSILTNLIVIPLSNIALAVGFLVIITSIFSMWLAEIFSLTAKFILNFLLSFIDYFADFDFSFVETYAIDSLSLIFYYTALITLFSTSLKNYKAKLTIVSLIIFNYWVISSVLNRKSEVQLTYLDVGNSNSCLISAPDNIDVMINAGSSTVKYNSADRTIVPYLKGKHINKLDLLIITGLNMDEFRNMINFVKKFQVSRIIVPGYYKSLLTNAYFKNIFHRYNIEFVEESKIIKDFENLRLYLYYDNKVVSGKYLYVQFIVGNKIFTFSDSKDLSENNFYEGLLSKDSALSVLKVSDAGSFNYTSPMFIINSNPDYAVISSSKFTKMKLHSEIFESSLKHIGIETYRTGESGAVIFKTDGINTEVVDWK